MNAEPTFDYSVWTPNTNICLCSVPWDNSYRDVVSFESEEKKRAYFNSLQTSEYTIVLDHLVYLKYGEPIRLAIPFSAANRCSYIVVKNQKQPIPDYGAVNVPDTFYYFINDIRYIAPNCTELIVQLDVWTTYHDRVSYEYCYVERGHVGIANENATLSTLNSYLVEPEGFEQGSYYNTADIIFESFLQESPWIVLMCSAQLEDSWGTVNAPTLTTSVGGINDGLPNGCSCYGMSSGDFEKLMSELKKAPWVGQCIQMITVIPRPLIELDEDPITIAGATVYKLQANPTVSSGAQYSYANPSSHFKIPSRYQNLLKFFTSPYTTIELTNYAGASIVFGLQDIYTPSTLRIGVRNICNPPNIRAYIFPGQMHAQDGVSAETSYKTVSDTTLSTVIDGGDFVASSLVYENFPQCAVANNQYLTYLASTANTRAFQQQSADWAQNKALTAASMSYDQSTASTQNMLSNTALSNAAQWAQTGIANEQTAWGAVQGGISSVAGAAGSLASGNVGGAAANLGSGIMGAVNAGMQVGWNNQQTGISTGLASATAANNARLSNYVRDTNYDYAQFAAKGDYQTTIAAIQAKVDDAKLTPPSLSGTTGGDGFNIANGLYGFALKFKVPPHHFIHQIGEFWLRYGYSINRFMKPPADLKCMTHFTYWKMQNVMLLGDLPESHKNTIRGILESGVTIWNDPREINSIDFAENEPLGGVAY